MIFTPTINFQYNEVVLARISNMTQNATKVMVKCPRCNGQGAIKVYQHVRAGVCSRCRINKDNLVGPGDCSVEVRFDGEVIRLDRENIHLEDLASLGRADQIHQAAGLLSQMEAEKAPRGSMIVRLLALAVVVHSDVRARIVRALLHRARAWEVEEVRAVARLFGVVAKEAV